MSKHAPFHRKTCFIIPSKDAPCSHCGASFPISRRIFSGATEHLFGTAKGSKNGGGSSQNSVDLDLIRLQNVRNIYNEYLTKQLIISILY